MIRWPFLALLSLPFAIPSLASGGTLVQFRTMYGELEVELYDQQKPATVANFKRLVQSGEYYNTFFHRLVPGFVVQGGGFYTQSKALTNMFGPPWFHIGGVGNFGSITNEYLVGPRLSNTNGTIAMAKQGGSPDSATCEWFFNLGNNSVNLDNQNGGFTVFGRVVRDQNNLLGLFNALSYGDGLQSLGWYYPNDPLATNLFTQLPVIYTGVIPPRIADLFYVDVTMLSVQISQTNQTRYISWNSVNGKTNVVEYTTNFPPAWFTLANTNGNGSRITVPDNSPGSRRFYRVRVLY